MGQKNLEYSIYGALAAGVTLRPADEMRRLGLDVLKFEAMPIFDCIRVKSKDLPAVNFKTCPIASIICNKRPLSLIGSLINQFLILINIFRHPGKEHLFVN